MTTLVFLLEERSARALLEGLLPRLLPEHITVRFIVFEGKQDLDKQLERRLRGWLAPDSRFVVLRDQDSGACIELKNALKTKCGDAGRADALVRIACRELEAWYFGDLEAVERALSLANLSRHSAKAKYRDSDRIVCPSRELGIITNQAYQKVSGSRAIGPHLSLGSQNRSRSFQVFIAGIRRLLKN